MKKTHFAFLILIVVSIFGLTGCAFTVKNTNGLALAYKDIDRAASYASELKSMGGITKLEEEDAADLYRQAKSEINGYLKKAITDASDYTVNNPEEEYLTTTNGTAKVDAFENKVKELRRIHIMSAVPAWIPVFEVVLKAIWDINQKAREEGRKIFEETVTKYMMKSYEEIPLAKRMDK